MRDNFKRKYSYGQKSISVYIVIGIVAFLVLIGSIIYLSVNVLSKKPAAKLADLLGYPQCATANIENGYK